MVHTADVIVIGAGVIGASIALELSRNGRSVIVVDKAGAPGHGSTSASSAVIRFNYSTWEGVATSWESKFRWEDWEEHLGYSDPNGNARFVRCGLVFLDAPSVPKSKMVALFERAGIPFDEWTPSELADALPSIDIGSYFPPKPVASPEFFEPPREELGGLYTPDAGYIDDPQLAAANLAHAAEHRGATFVFRRSVCEITRRSGAWRAILDNGDTFEAPIIVNGAGPWSTSVNTMAGVGGDFLIDVAPMRQEVHQAPLPDALKSIEFPVIADVDLGTYIRPDSDHSLLVGGTEPECDPLEWINDPDESSPTPTIDRFEAQMYRAARRFPDLRVPNRPRGVAGVYDVASDWTPIYDATDRRGFYVAMGTSGNQFKNAPVVGDLMRTIIDAVEGGHDHDAVPVTFEAPHTGHSIDLGFYSRRRKQNDQSSGTVFG